MAAHIVGIPVEETLPWLMPLGGLGLAGLVAFARASVRH